MAFGQYALIGVSYIPSTQPALNLAVVEAQMPQEASSSLDLARSQATSLLSEGKEDAVFADLLHQEMEDAAGLPRVIAGLADLAALTSSPTLIVPAFAEALVKPPSPAASRCGMLACLCASALMILLGLMVFGMFAWYRRHSRS